MKKNKILIVIIVLIAVTLFIKFILPVSIILLSNLGPADNKKGLENYNKDYYIDKYGGDLDSGLYIFPDRKIVKDGEFSSSMKTNLFDTDGYILLKVKYSDKLYEDEVNRLKNIELSVTLKCGPNSPSFTNKVMYDDTSYNYPAYVTIDNCFDTYEYALLNEETKEIYYVYLSYPKTSNKKYKEYLKKDKKEYYNLDSICNYSLYNHTFDKGKSYSEFDDCGK